jgi:hypothetical protein
MFGESQDETGKLIRGTDSHEALADQTKAIEVGCFPVFNGIPRAIGVE